MPSFGDYKKLIYILIFKKNKSPKKKEKEKEGQQIPGPLIRCCAVKEKILIANLVHGCHVLHIKKYYTQEGKTSGKEDDVIISWQPIFVFKNNNYFFPITFTVN